MDSTYVGDSPGKKLARARLWINGAQLWHRLGLPFVGAYVLAGEGGDVGVLDAIGTPRCRIAAVDLDPECSSYVGELYPGIEWGTGEAGKLSKMFWYNTGHLDFCNGLTAENIRTVAEVVKNSHGPMLLGVTMMKGREAPAKNCAPLSDMSRSQRRRALRTRIKSGHLVGNQILRGNGFDPSLAIQRAKDRMRKMWAGFENSDSREHAVLRGKKCTPLGNSMVRLDALRQCVNAVLLPTGIELVCVSVFGYHSKSRQSNGTPFVTGVMISCPFDQSYDLMQTIQKMHGDMIRMGTMSAKDSWACLKPSVLEMARFLPVETVASLFDLRPQTVIAWKAHETRGSYVGRKGKPLLLLPEPPDGVEGYRFTSKEAWGWLECR